MATFSNASSANSTTSTATLDVTGITAAVGDFLLLAVAADNAGTAGVSSTSATITDAAGNTWTRRAETNVAPGGAPNAGTTLGIWTCTVTFALSSATITVNFSPNTTSKAAIVKKVAPAAGETVAYNSVGAGATGNSTTWDAPTVSVPQGSTIFGYVAVESTGPGAAGDSDTTNGSWSADHTTSATTGAANTSQAISEQHKTVTATGNQSYGRTAGSARDWAANWLIIEYLSAGSSSGTSTAAGAPVLSGAAAGVATAAATAKISGDAAGTSTATAVAAPDVTAAGTAAGTSAATAVGSTDVSADGSAAGTSTATATSTAEAVGAGDAAGTSTASAVSVPVATAVGTAAGTSSANAIADVGPVIEAEITIREPRDIVSITMATGWPTMLPIPTLQGYSFRPSSSVERKPMEFGAPRVYRRSRKPPIEVAVAWGLDAEQQALLDGFQTSTLQEGEGWFGIELAFPAGFSLAMARFKDKVVMRPLGGPRWQTTATLELLTRPMMTDAELTDILDDEDDPPAWPTDILPYPTLDSSALNPKPATARTEDLPGLPQQRQRSRDSTTEVAAEWELTAEQAAIFDAFFHYRGRDGAQWFAFPLVQAIGIVTTKVRFLGEADWTPRGGGGRWAVTAPIEIRERRVLTATEVSAQIASW